jgi:hypothetical protein
MAQPRLGCRGSGPAQNIEGWYSDSAGQLAGQQLRLVEPALPASPPVQGYRHENVEPLIPWQSVRKQACQRFRQRANARVLIQVDQLSQGAIVISEGICRIKTTKAVAA